MGDVAQYEEFCEHFRLMEALHQLEVVFGLQTSQNLVHKVAPLSLTKIKIFS